MNAAEVVVVGVVGAPFGVKGWIHVRSFTEPAENLLAYQPWLLGRAERWEAVTSEARAHRGGFVAHLGEAGDRDAAAAMAGLRIGVDAALLPPPAENETYWRDLVGLHVASLSGEALGVVSRIVPMPAHDVLAIDDGGRERLIPFVREIVADVDLAAGRLRVDWQPGWP